MPSSLVGLEKPLGCLEYGGESMIGEDVVVV